MLRTMLALGLAIGWVSAAAAAAANMAGDEIQQKLIGHLQKWKSEKFHGSGTTIYNKDGTYTVTPDGGGKPETGTWKIKGNGICTIKTGTKADICNGPYDQMNDTTFYLFKYEAVVIVEP